MRLNRCVLIGFRWDAKRMEWSGQWSGRASEPRARASATRLLQSCDGSIEQSVGEYMAPYRSELLMAMCLWKPVTCAGVRSLHSMPSSCPICAQSSRGEYYSPIRYEQIRTDRIGSDRIEDESPCERVMVNRTRSDRFIYAIYL